ncbi:MAG: hypothetical protein QF502_02175 [Nitrospinaceae bacterium]|nr:hypothetical protein [Nitrospinaceae bacterium]
MKRDSEQENTLSPKEDQSSQEPKPEKRGWLSLARICIGLLLSFVLLVVVAGIVLEYYLPSETLTPIARRELSRVLKTPVDIQRIDLSLLRGVSLNKLGLGKDNSIISIERVVLDYDLSQIMRGVLVINQIIVDRPTVHAISKNGIWNFQPLLELGGTGGSAKKQTDKPEDLPLVPFAIDLKKLVVKNISLNLDMDGQMKARLDGLTLSAQGSANLSGIDLMLNVKMVPPADKQGHNIEFFNHQPQEIIFKTRAETDLNFSTRDLNKVALDGTFGFAHNRVRAGRDLPSTDISGNASLDVTVKEQELNLHSIKLGLGQNNQVELSGQVRKFLANPEFNLAIDNGSFDLGELVRIAGPLIPRVKAQGLLKIARLQAKGEMPGFKPETIELRNGDISMKNFSADHDDLGAHIENMNMNLALKEAIIENTAPKVVDADVDVSIEKGRLKELAFSGLNKKVSFQVSGPNLSSAKVNANSSLNEVRYQHPDFGTVGTSLKTHFAAEGDFIAGHFESVEASLHLGDFFETAVKAEAKNFGKEGFNASHKLALDMSRTMPLLPKNLSDKLKGLGLSGVIKTSHSIEGKLDSAFQPQKVNIKSDINLRSMNIKLENPEASIQQFNADVSLPVEYDAAQGIKVPWLMVKTESKGIQALDNWKVEPFNTELKVAMEKFYPLSGNQGILPVTAQITFQTKAVKSANPPLEIRGLALSTSLKGDLHGRDARNLTAKATMTFDGTNALDKVSTGSAKTEIIADVHDISLTRTRLSIKSQVNAPSLKEGDLQIKLGKVAFESLSRQDLKKGKIDLNRLQLNIPALLQINARGNVEEWGKSIDFENLLGSVQLAPLWALVPQAIKGKLPALEIEGTAGFQLTAKGELPEKFSLESSDLPFEAQTVFGLNNVSLSVPEIEGLNIKNLSTKTRVGIKNNSVGIEGKVSMAKLSLTDVLDETTLDPDFNFKYTLDGFDKLSVKNHQLTLPSSGIQHTLKGRVEGLKRFIAGKSEPTPAELTKRLNISLITKNKIDLEKALAEIPVTGESMKGKGTLGTSLNVSLAPGNHLILDGAVGFGKIRVGIPDKLQVGEINGKFLFNKKFLLDENLLPATTDKFSASRKGFFNQVRDHSRHKNILRIDAITAQGIKATGINLDLFFRDNHLAVEKFLFDVLGGSVAGNLFLEQTPEGPVMNFSTEFAALDFENLAQKTTGRGGRKNTSVLNTAEKILGAALGIRKDDLADLDGNLKLSFKVKQGEKTGKINLDQVGANIAITRIGPELLDRVLLFLDPEESKPAILETRLKLKLASPHRILIRIENGNLSVEAWLKNKLMGGIIKAPELRRVPISSLKNFDQISEQLQVLSGLNEALQYLSANGVVFEKDGTLKLF